MNETMRAVWSSNSEDWETPQALFGELEKEFGFSTDVCASPENAKCDHYFTKEMDGLKMPWRGVCWCNPPYGREIRAWVAKASEEAKAGKATTVMLLPARTDTKWFHDYVYKKAEVRFIKGRLRFGNSKANAPFPSMVVVFNKEDEG